MKIPYYKQVKQNNPTVKNYLTVEKESKSDDELWAMMFCSVANAINCKTATIASDWADTGMKRLNQFRKDK